MAAQPGPGMWWRWRAGPLRRGSDLLEGWILLVTAVLVAVGTFVGGILTGTAAYDTAQAQQEQRRQVRAELLEDPVTARGSDSARHAASGGEYTLARARWTGPDGTTHENTVRVGREARAGSTVPLWVDEQGRRTAEPAGPGLIRFHAVLCGLLAAGALAAVVLGLQHAARRALDRYRLAQWERAWAEVEPRWRPRTP